MSTVRIPQAQITGVLGTLVKQVSKRKFGGVPEPLGIYWHNRPVLRASMGIGGKVEKWRACDPNLKSFAHMAVSSHVGCSFCMDFGYVHARDKKLDVDKAREVPRWRESEVFTPLERDVMEYAEAMSQTPPTVTDELSARLLRALAARRAERPRRFHEMSADPFVRHRRLLFTVAYEMLGSAADAEDVVQEAWLRWVEVDAAGVRDPRAYLVRVVTRQALNRLRTLARRREEYVGEWLPEPLLTGPDVAEDVELAERISIAMLTVLETLNPAERAVFVLREVFDTPYDEIAEAVGKTPAAVRQIAHRAREHVAARRPRMEVDRAEQRVAVERFAAALQTGDVQELLEVLAPDVVLRADGGGVVPAFRRPIEGAERVARLVATFARVAPGARLDTIWLNGAPAVRIDPEGEINTAVSLVVDGGRITRIYAIRNPHKLTRLDAEAELTR